MRQAADKMRTTRRSATLAACIVLVALYVWLAARSFQAARLASSLDVPSLQRAIELEPRDAAYQDLLCRFLIFDKQEPGAAVPFCKRATGLNSYNSTYWLDLALAYYNLGAGDEQRQAIREAVAVDPTTPDVAWKAANFFLVQGESAEALREFAVAMRGDPALVRPSLDLCWRTLHDVNAIQAILPPDPGAYLMFIRLLTTKHQWEQAHQVWFAMVLLNRAVDYRQALFYVDGLLQQHEVARATEAWEQLASRSATLSDYRSPGNLVVNGGFEEEILNAGFDWRYDRQSGSAASVDATVSHSGSKSLAVLYHGAGGDSGVFQYVPVKPHTAYRLAVWTKSRDLESANGPRIGILDAYDGKIYAQTSETWGTTDWHRLEASFTTSAETELVSIRLSRDPAGTIIEGRFWLDDVTLRPQAEPASKQD